MNRPAAALAVTFAAGALGLTGCTDPQTACERDGGTWQQQWMPKYGGYPAHWEYRCIYPLRPLPKPTIVTGVAGPGIVVMRFKDGGKLYLKIQQDGAGRVVQKVPAEVYRKCKDRARWPECAR